MTDRIQGILNRASDAPKFSGVRWILGDGVLTNYMQSFVDDTMKRNAEFQSKAGVSPKIVRKSPTKCCPWCDALVGEYKYPDDVPDDVYRRHDNCNCIVEFYPGDGKKQDVWSKQWSDEEPEIVKARKTVGLETPETPKRIPNGELSTFAEGYPIEYDEVKPLEKKLSDEEIIARLAGDDKTSGSCCSVAYAYAGNKAGLDVLDFRGGKSCGFFAMKINGARIAQIENAGGKIVYMKSDFKAARELLNSADKSEEHILRCGRHGAVVKWFEDEARPDGGYWAYLELQSESKRGWSAALDDDVLKWRFGCGRHREERIASIVSVDKLKESDEFKDLLGYINTPEAKQKKGLGGGIK